MSDIQEEQKRLYKRAEENDLIQIAYKMTKNTLLMQQAGDKVINKINELQNDCEKLYKEKVELINLILNIDFQCYCAKLKTPTIKHISKMIKEYQNNYKEEE